GQHHQRESFAQTLYERHLGEPADRGGSSVGCGAVRGILQHPGGVSRMGMSKGATMGANATSMPSATAPSAAPVASTRIAAYGLVSYLERLGVEVVFGLCGHTIIAMLDALRGSTIRYVSVRHEQVATHAADGYARASGKPGVALLHLGPGLICGATGVANAALDSMPMVVIAGDVPSYYYGRHPHQEINLHQDADQFQIYRPFCKR